MLNSIDIAMSGLKGFSDALQTLSSDVSNMNTPGFKGSNAVFEDALNAQRDSSGIDSGGAGEAGLSSLAVRLDLSAGQTSQSTNDLAVAVNGSGMFVVQGADGETHYTRDGDFQLDSQGNLLASDGKSKVMGISANGSLSPISIASLQTSAPKATTDVTFSGNLSSSATSDTIGSVDVYDSNGTEHTLQVALSTTTATAGTWTATVTEGSTTVGTGTIKFVSGAPDPANASITLNYAPAGASSQQVTLDFSSNVTSFSAGTTSTLAMASQNGYGSGTLQSETFDQTGTMTLTYSNGQTIDGPQLALATYASPAQVVEVGSNEFDAAPGATWTIGRANQGGFGSIAANELENSNVDLSQAFSELVIVERGYQASSELISTTNDMIEKLFGMGGGQG